MTGTDEKSEPDNSFATTIFEIKSRIDNFSLFIYINV